MEVVTNIALRMYEWISTTLFGEVIANEWYSSHLDVIRGVTTVIMCGLVVLIALWLVVAVGRFLGGIFGMRR